MSSTEDAIHEIRRLLQASLEKTEEIRRLSEKTEAELRDLGVIVQTISEKMDINEERMQKIRNDIQLNGDRLTMLQTQQLAQASSAVKYGPEPRELVPSGRYVTEPRYRWRRAWFYGH